MSALIFQHINGLGIGGMEYCLQNLLKYLKKISNHNYVLCYKAQSDRTREHLFREILGENRLVAYASIPEFIEILRECQPDILNHWSAGITEFPMIEGVRELLPKTKLVQTAIFSNTNEKVKMDAVVHISHHVSKIMPPVNAKHILTIRHPVEEVDKTVGDYRKELCISEDTFIFGHIGRPDPNTYDDLNIRAYAKIQNENTLFMVQGVDEFAREVFKKYGIKRYSLLKKTIDRRKIDKFYNTINCLAHSRKDGECSSSVIYEAMSAGIPIVSTYGYPYNGHIEQIQNAGMISLKDDVDSYAQCMQHILNCSKENREYFSNNGRRLWKEYAEPHDRAIEMLNLYDSLLNGDIDNVKSRCYS